MAFVAEFVQAEPGCAHPISDRYAASLVLATLMLLDGQRADVANILLEQATVWLCDHYDNARAWRASKPTRTAKRRCS